MCSLWIINHHSDYAGSTIQTGDELNGEYFMSFFLVIIKIKRKHPLHAIQCEWKRTEKQNENI